ITLPTKLYTLSLHDALPISNTSINKILGLLYFSLALLNANKLFSINKQSISFLYLIALWIVFLTSSLINHFSFGHTLQLSVNFLDRKSTRLNSSHVSISYAV